MPRFHELTVTDVQKTIRDAVVVTLRPQDAAAFDFIQGQYLTFRRDFDGTEVRRSYSICAGRGEGLLQVGIKKVDGGAFSTWANEDLAPGMVLEAMAPMGSFHTPLDPGARRSYLGFAGGSGITPVLSILKTVLAQEPQSDFTLVYANRGVNTIMFREDLEDLKNLYMGRLNIIHVLESDAQEIELFQGRVDAEKSAALLDHGLSDDQIKFELFASAQPGRLPQKARAADSGTQSRETAATVTIDGTARSFRMGKDLSILDAALQNDLDAPFACKAGVCSTCKCRVLEGEVEMIANHALEDYEVARGYVLSCQSYPLTDRVVVDYDQ